MNRARSGLWLGLVLGAGLDAVFADPRRGHPVAAFGRTAGAVEARMWADSRARGVLYAVGCVGAVAVAASLADGVVRPLPLRVAIVALSTWAVLGGTSLAREGAVMGDLLERDDLAGARARLPHLCGRDPSGLDAEGLARATVESVAENTSDAVVAPLFWGAVAGVPGLLGVPRRQHARRDGRAPQRPVTSGSAGPPPGSTTWPTWLPARLTGLLAAALAPLVGGSPRGGAARRCGATAPTIRARTPGRCEAAFAGALGVRLGGTNVYGARVEQRGLTRRRAARRRPRTSRGPCGCRGPSASRRSRSRLVSWLRAARASRTSKRAAAT